MSRLVLVVPLREGARQQALELVEKGPPFDVESTHLVRHEVFLTDKEVVFDFETVGGKPPIELQAERPVLHEAAQAWDDVMAGRPRKAVRVFSWERGS